MSALGQIAQGKHTEEAIRLSDSDSWNAHVEGMASDRLSEFLEEQSRDPLSQQVATTALQLLDLHSGHKVLEVGCGTGAFLPSLARAVGPTGHVDGIDHAAELLKRARARVEHDGIGNLVSVFKADATRLPLPDAHYDAAHVERVLMHLPHPEVALAEMRRVVKPGGVVVAAEPFSRGAHFDHPDFETMEAILARTTARIRNPAIGLALMRLMAQAGLVDRRIGVSFGLLTNYPPVEADSHRRAAMELVEEGILSRSQVEGCLEYLHDAVAAGTLMGYALVFVVAGRVPMAA